MGEALASYATDDISHDLKKTVQLLYAHDATIMSFVKSSEDRPLAATILNRDLPKIETWAKTWNILFGVAKCKTTTISNLRDAEGNHPTLHFFCVTLEEADSLDLLGLTLYNNLSSEPSGHQNVNTAGQRLGLPQKSFSLFSTCQAQRAIIYKAMHDTIKDGKC